MKKEHERHTPPTEPYDPQRARSLAENTFTADQTPVEQVNALIRGEQVALTPKDPEKIEEVRQLLLGILFEDI